MKDLWKVVLVFVGGLLVAGIILVVISPPRGEAITLTPPPSPEPILVHVSGAVIEPGVYSLPPSSRVGDAIETAGGLLPDAYPQTLNLAAFITDGARVYVPFQPTPTSPGGIGVTAPSRSIQIDIEGPININTASQEELETLPGIGPVTAEKIIEYRTTIGPFSTIEEIQEVSGIGPKTFEDIKDLITVEISP